MIILWWHNNSIAVSMTMFYLILGIRELYLIPLQKVHKSMANIGEYI